MHEISLCRSTCAILIISRNDVGKIPRKGSFMLKCLSVLCSLTLFISLQSAMAQGRAPAVEPEMGISIEEYQEVHSGPEKGFDFTGSTPGVSAHKDRQARTLTGQAKLPPRRGGARTPSATTQAKAPSPMWTLFALTALPFGLWLLLRQTFPKDTAPTPNSSQSDSSEAITIDLATERMKRKSFEDDEEDKHSNVG